MSGEAVASIVIGLGILKGGGVSIAMLVAVFVSNLPEGLSSSAGMRRVGCVTSTV